MQKSDKHIKAIELRNKYKNQLLNILSSQSTIKAGKREFPIYFDNWVNRLLKLEYLIIGLKYNFRIKN